MRTLLQVTCSAILGLVMLCAVRPGTARGAETAWILLDDNSEHSAFYYDKADIGKLGKGIFRVTARVVYKPQGKAETLDLLKHPKEFEALAESRYVYNMDCKQGRSQLLNVTHLDNKNARIKTFDLSGVTEWEDIPPAARLELITDEVCAK
jgi:surface-adhesin protein E